MQDLSPIITISSPTYAEALKKKPVESSDSSEEDEQFTKKAGRKSRKDIGEEAKKLKMQGSQDTIELSFGRSKWNRSPKGGVAPSFSSK